MMILSQNKKTIVNTERIISIYLECIRDGEYWIVATDGTTQPYTLGVYGREEQAEQILLDIYGEAGSHHAIHSMPTGDVS